MGVIRKVSLRQYRTTDGKWQFCAVPKDAKGKPRPNLVVVNGEIISSNSPGGGNSTLTTPMRTANGSVNHVG